MGKTAAKVARIGESEITHEIRGEFRYDRTDNRTMCGRRGIFGIDSLQSGKELPITCNACLAAGPRWIVYLHIDEPGRPEFGLSCAENLREAREALDLWREDKRTDNVSASLYPFTPENWQDANEFESVGCPFDYPSKLIERGPRGGLRIVRA